MIWHVEAGGRTRAVEVRREDAHFVVSLDGREHVVDVSQVNDIWSFLVAGPLNRDIGSDAASRAASAMRSYEISFAGGPGGAMIVRVNGHPVAVRLDSLRSVGGGGRQDAAPGASGPQRIAAPMPGKIVKVLVKAGDSVAARQGLVVVEAMKMENELRAAASGTVSEVLVREGSSVEAGAILVIVN